MNNELTNIPETICNIYDNLTVFSIGINNICPPYPDCIEDNMEEQDTTNCDQVSIIDETLPMTYNLHNAYPNPFNPVTTLNFGIPVEAEVFIKIYNLQGREVYSLIDGNMEAGYHSVQWEANSAASGVYFVKMIAGDFVSTQKLMLIK